MKIDNEFIITDVADKVEDAESAMCGITFGELVRMIRTKAGLSQDALARRCCVQQSLVSRIENDDLS